MTIRSHLRELRNRFVVVVVCLVVIAGVAYMFRDGLIKILLAPLGGQSLVYLTPGGGFNFIFSVSLLTGIAASVPLAIYQLYQYIAPSLPRQLRQRSMSLLVSSLLLLLIGVAFGYFVAIPGAIHFLSQFAADYVQASLTAESYLNFVVVYTIGLGILFQLPLIMVIAHWIWQIPVRKLLSFEKWAIVASVVLAAIITPTPDVVNMLLVATPLLLMYQIGVVAVAFSHRRNSAVPTTTKSEVTRPVKQSNSTATGPLVKQPRATQVPPATTPAVQRQRKPKTMDFVTKTPTSATPVSATAQPLRRRPSSSGQALAHPSTMDVKGPVKTRTATTLPSAASHQSSASSRSQPAPSPPSAPSQPKPPVRSQPKQTSPPPMRPVSPTPQSKPLPSVEPPHRPDRLQVPPRLDTSNPTPTHRSLDTGQRDMVQKK